MEQSRPNPAGPYRQGGDGTHAVTETVADDEQVAVSVQAQGKTLVTCEPAGGTAHQSRTFAEPEVVERGLAAEGSENPEEDDGGQTEIAFLGEKSPEQENGFSFNDGTEKDRKITKLTD